MFQAATVISPVPVVEPAKALLKRRVHSVFRLRDPRRSSPAQNRVTSGSPSSNRPKTSSKGEFHSEFQGSVIPPPVETAQTSSTGVHYEFRLVIPPPVEPAPNPVVTKPRTRLSSKITPSSTR